MHSSRMHPARLLPVSPSMHCSRGVGVVPVLGGCTWSQGDGVPGPGGCTWSLGVYLVGGGVYLVRWVCTWSEGCTWSWGGVPAQVLPPVNRMTNRCKNITLPQTSFAGGKNNRHKLANRKFRRWLQHCLVKERSHAVFDHQVRLHRTLSIRYNVNKYW